MTKYDWAVVIPIYNEMKRIGLVTEFSHRLIEALSDQQHRFAVIYVNDGSNDSSETAINSLIDELMAQYTGIHITQTVLPQNTKKSGMYQASLSCINAARYIFVDADFSFGVDDIIRCTDMAQNHDVILAEKKYDTQQPNRTRQFVSYVNTKLIAILFRNTVRETQTGLKIFSFQAALHTFHKVKPWHGFASDFVVVFEAYQQGFNIQHIEVNAIHREGSHVSIVRDSLHYLAVVLMTLPSAFRAPRKFRAPHSQMQDVTNE